MVILKRKLRGKRVLNTRETRKLDRKVGKQEGCLIEITNESGQTTGFQLVFRSQLVRNGHQKKEFGKKFGTIIIDWSEVSRGLRGVDDEICVTPRPQLDPERYDVRKKHWMETSFHP